MHTHLRWTLRKRLVDVLKLYDYAENRGDTKSAQAKKNYVFSEADNLFVAMDVMMGNYYAVQGVDNYYDEYGNGKLGQLLIDEQLNDDAAAMHEDLGFYSRAKDSITPASMATRMRFRCTMRCALILPTSS